MRIVIPVLALLTMGALSLMGHAAVEIRVYPRVVSGGVLRVTCRVEPDARNRLLEYGIQDYTSSQRDWPGLEAPITYQAPLYEHVPCLSGPAYCAIRRSDGKWIRTNESFEVVNCER